MGRGQPLPAQRRRDPGQHFHDDGPSIPVPFAYARWGSLASFAARPYPARAAGTGPAATASWRWSSSAPASAPGRSPPAAKAAIPATAISTTRPSATRAAICARLFLRCRPHRPCRTDLSSGPMKPAETDHELERGGMGPGLFAGRAGRCPGKVRPAFSARFIDLLLERRLPGGWDWSKDRDRITEMLAWPLDGLLWDVERNGLWWPEWGLRPRSRAERAEILGTSSQPRRSSFRSTATASSRKSRTNAAIRFSVHQSDIIYYGSDLAIISCANSWELSDHSAVRSHPPHTLLVGHGRSSRERCLLSRRAHLTGLPIAKIGCVG